MDEVLGDDLPLAATRLFDRLNQIPNYTWDKSVDAACVPHMHCSSLTQH